MRKSNATSYLRTSAAALLVVCCCCSIGRAAISNPADSSTFPFKYEGDAASLATFGNTGYSGGTSGYTLTGDSPSPGILDVSFDPAHANPGLIVYLQSPTYVATAQDATGWTWETSFRLKANSGPSNAATGRFTLRIGDNAGQDAIFEFLESGSVTQFGAGEIGNIGSFTDAQHVVRVAQEPASASYNLWVDGNLISDTLAGSFTNGPKWWSDGSGSTRGAYELDYVRFTAGGFSPPVVPEPASAVLLIAGVLGLARRRRSIA
jgi:hypothetical protein